MAANIDKIIELIARLQRHAELMANRAIDGHGIEIFDLLAERIRIEQLTRKLSALNEPARRHGLHLDRRSRAGLLPSHVAIIAQLHCAVRVMDRYFKIVWFLLVGVKLVCAAVERQLPCNAQTHNLIPIFSTSQTELIVAIQHHAQAITAHIWHGGLP